MISIRHDPTSGNLRKKFTNSPEEGANQFSTAAGTKFNTQNSTVSYVWRFVPIISAPESLRHKDYHQFKASQPWLPRQFQASVQFIVKSSPEKGGRRGERKPRKNLRKHWLHKYTSSNMPKNNSTRELSLQNCYKLQTTKHCQKKWKTSQTFRKNPTFMNMAIKHKVIYRCNIISIKIPMFSSRHVKNSQFRIKCKGVRSSQSRVEEQERWKTGASHLQQTYRNQNRTPLA